MSIQSGSTYGLRPVIDLRQPHESFRPFSLTTSTEDATTVLNVSDYMEEANLITFVVDKNDLYVSMGKDATADGTSMLVPAGTGYSDTGISFKGVISVIRANPGNGRIVGAVWGR